MTVELLNPSPVSLTPEAVAELDRLLTLDENKGKAFRLFVEQGGCSGMQYGMTFDEQREGDLITRFSGVPVVVDEVSLEYLRGVQLHFSDEMTGGGFKITNPKARESCGCGRSFNT